LAKSWQLNFYNYIDTTKHSGGQNILCPQWRTRRGGGGSGRLPGSKILKDKKYFNTVKNSSADSVFQGKCRFFKILKDKKYIQYGEFRAHSVFQGKHKLLKNPER